MAGNKKAKGIGCCEIHCWLSLAEISEGSEAMSSTAGDQPVQRSKVDRLFIMHHASCIIDGCLNAYMNFGFWDLKMDELLFDALARIARHLIP